MTLLILALLLADPKILTGRVVAISDGDTVTILDADKTQHKIRLAGIDAPEKKQAFGTKSREALAEMIHEKDVVVEWSSRDKYGRIIGVIRIGERNINREMIAGGWAWHYRQFSKSKGLQAAEDEAREKRRGLWADEKTPEPPWEFRKQKKAISRPGSLPIASRP